MQERSYFATCHLGRRIVHSILALSSVYSVLIDHSREIGFATGRGRRYDSDAWGSSIPKYPFTMVTLKGNSAR